MNKDNRLALAPLLGALPLAALVQAAGYWRYDVLAMSVVLLPGLLMSARLPWRTPPRPSWSFWPWGGLLVAVLGLAALSALAPPLDHDTIRYHLTLPRRDLETGHIWPWFGWSSQVAASRIGRSRTMRVSMSWTRSTDWPQPSQIIVAQGARPRKIQIARSPSSRRWIVSTR